MCPRAVPSRSRPYRAAPGAPGGGAARKRRRAGPGRYRPHTAPVGPGPRPAAVTVRRGRGFVPGASGSWGLPATSSIPAAGSRWAGDPLPPRRGWLGVCFAVPGKAVPGVSYCPGNSSAPWMLPEPPLCPSAVLHGHSAGAGGSGRHSPALPALPWELGAITGCLSQPHHGNTWPAPVSSQVALSTGDTSLPAPVLVPGWPCRRAGSAEQDPLPGPQGALTLAEVWGGLTAPRALPARPAAPTQLLLMTTPYIAMATGTGDRGLGSGGSPAVGSSPEGRVPSAALPVWGRASHVLLDQSQPWTAMAGPTVSPLARRNAPHTPGTTVSTLLGCLCPHSHTLPTRTAGQCPLTGHT